MNLKSLMIESLTELLESGETLMHPIYGILEQTNRQYHGFFGFTETSLLIVLISGQTIIDTIRVPLEIKSIKLRQALLSNQHSIDISFYDESPCRILAYPKVSKIDTQSENLPKFIEYLKAQSPKQNQQKLKNIDGKKIRMQFCDLPICILISLLPMFLFAFFTSNTFVRDTNFEALMALLILPFMFVPLALANKFLFGSIICVMDDHGLFLENDFIAWKDIKKIEYHPELPAKHTLNFTYLTMIIKGQRTSEYRIDIPLFPFYGLFVIKKHHPDIPIEIPRNKKILFGFLLAVPTLITLILALLP